ncbi:hypothetical protein WJX72_010910 [[Myrmecia] bisecta]|uniref:Uncharacterized protein n=1 Tax=[Myrmecia] bisecta TaxID=41462 RepID=A0AAW1PXU5_9CHLO
MQKPAAQLQHSLGDLLPGGLQPSHEGAHGLVSLMLVHGVTSCGVAHSATFVACLAKATLTRWCREFMMLVHYLDQQQLTAILYDHNLFTPPKETRRVSVLSRTCRVDVLWLELQPPEAGSKSLNSSQAQVQYSVARAVLGIRT